MSYNEYEKYASLLNKAIKVQNENEKQKRKNLSGVISSLFGG